MTEPGPQRPRVLVVDDQPPNIRLLEAILTPRGYDVRTASSGEEALEVIAGTDIDLVLLDIVMPGMDGYEVCRTIREHTDTAYLPVVMVTASGDEQKVQALEAGADDFLSKPINQNELLARVASLARIKQVPGHHQAPGRRARRLEPGAGVPGRDAGGAAAADGAAASLPLPAAGRADRRLGGRVVPREPPARGRGRLLRPAGVHHVRRVQRAGRGDGGAERVPRRRSAT